MERLGLYVRTLSNLQAGQIGYLIVRRLLPRPTPNVRARGPVQRKRGVTLRSPLTKCFEPGMDWRFRFLNVAKVFDRRAFDWSSPEMSRLWRYNLHYFDYIVDRGRSIDEIEELLDSWIARNPPGRGEGWEPYPLSLRIVNWIKLFLRDDFVAHVKPAWLASLHEQACWIERHLEYHLRANHLVKNAKALFFAGAYFEGSDAKRWCSKGVAILTREAREQMLDDGGHFERSPMYHALVVEDYLDVLNLMNERPASSPDTVALRRMTCRALDFLRDVTHPDGSLALFNDAACGIAPSYDGLAEYAGRVIAYRSKPAASGMRLAKHEASGYFVVRNGDDMLMVDCGEMGPRYQLGHAHCDTLSFELTFDRQQLIVDSGVYDYDDSAMRRYVRSTRAHNTATIDGEEQAELWAAFRVARRARPRQASLVAVDAATARFSGSHDGFAHLAGRPVHERTIDYEVAGRCTVVDRFTGSGEHVAQSFIHVHPDFAVSMHGSAIVLENAEGAMVARIDVLEAQSITLGAGWYCPEFGKRLVNGLVTLSSSGPFPRRLAYRIVKQASAGANAA